MNGTDLVMRIDVPAAGSTPVRKRLRSRTRSASSIRQRTKSLSPRLIWLPLWRPPHSSRWPARRLEPQLKRIQLDETAYGIEWICW